MIKIINHKKYFKEVNEYYNEVVKDYIIFKNKINKKNKINLLFSLKLLSKSIYKFRSAIKNIYLGKESVDGKDKAYRPKEK